MNIYNVTINFFNGESKSAEILAENGKRALERAVELIPETCDAHGFEVRCFRETRAFILREDAP